MKECVYCRDGIWHGEYIARCVICKTTNSHITCNRSFRTAYNTVFPCDLCGSAQFITGFYTNYIDAYIKCIKQIIST